jgi:hypothetical protein
MGTAAKELCAEGAALSAGPEPFFSKKFGDGRRQKQAPISRRKPGVSKKAPQNPAKKKAPGQFFLTT